MLAHSRPCFSSVCLLSFLYALDMVYLSLQVGEVFGSDSQQAKGQVRETKGDAQHDTAQAKGYVQGAVDSVVGTAKARGSSALVKHCTLCVSQLVASDRSI